MNINFFNVDQLLAGIDLTPSRPTLDLSSVTFIHPYALVYIGMYLRHFNAMGKWFDVRLPENPDVRRYLARMRFWERFNFNPSVVERENLLRLTKSTSLNDMVDIESRPYIAEEVAERVQAVLRGEEVKINHNRMVEMVAELVDNFAQHSSVRLAACTFQYYPRLRNVTFAIGDCGIGIRHSLASNPKFSNLAEVEHYSAALKAFEPLVTRKPEGGTGLTEVRDGVMRAGGALVLTTGDGYVRINPRRTQVGKMAFDLPGVQVEISLPEKG